TVPRTAPAKISSRLTGSNASPMPARIRSNIGASIDRAVRERHVQEPLEHSPSDHEKACGDGNQPDRTAHAEEGHEDQQKGAARGEEADDRDQQRIAGQQSDRDDDAKIADAHDSFRPLSRDWTSRMTERTISPPSIHFGQTP